MAIAPGPGRTRDCGRSLAAASWEMPLQEELAELELTVARIVQESGRPDGFDAQRWLQQWVSEPVAALGGRRPLDVLAEPGGLELVRTTLLRMQSGAYS